MIFPTLFAEKHAYAGFSLPVALEGDLNALVIAFQQRHQEAVESWLPVLEARSVYSRDFRYYIAPTVQRLPEIQQEFIDVGMKMPNGCGTHLLPLYVDLNEFNRAFDIPTVSQIYVLLLDPSGEMLWQTHGRYSDDKAAGLSAAIIRRTTRPLIALSFLRRSAQNASTAGMTSFANVSSGRIS